METGELVGTLGAGEVGVADRTEHLRTPGGWKRYCMENKHVQSVCVRSAENLLHRFPSFISLSSNININSEETTNS